MRTGELPSPLRSFQAGLDDIHSTGVFDHDRIGRMLVDLAADEDYLGPLVADIPPEQTGGTWLIRPDRGPRLLLFHRPEGAISFTHSHHCWVAIAPVRGVETHQRWEAVCHEGGRADLRLADERALRRGDVVTLIPPGDVHSHGHVAGTGPSPYSLILLGDDQMLFEREEFDLEQGTWRVLPPADPGQMNR